MFLVPIYSYIKIHTKKKSLLIYAYLTYLPWYMVSF